MLLCGQERDEAKAALDKVESVWKAKQDAALQALTKQLEAAQVRGADYPCNTQSDFPD